MSDKKIKLPSEVYIKEGVTQRAIKWPKQLYQDLFKICQVTGNSITTIVIALVRDFVKENNHVLNNKGE